LFDLEIARILFDRERKRILDVTILRGDFRFRCKRCGVFCCMLGGPIIKRIDLKRMVDAGLNPSKFIEPAERRFSQQRDVVGVLKQKDDGSCIFLKYDEAAEIYTCEIYEARPNVCRLYPFELLIEGDEGILRVIPCCNGLSLSTGEKVDRRFIEEHLLDSLLENL